MRRNEPARFALANNYPNPFNRTTIIGFDLPLSSIVTIKVYNMLGQEVATALSEELMDEGSHELEFNASSLPSGVYFYRVTGKTLGDEEIAPTIFSGVRKMLLIK